MSNPGKSINVKLNSSLPRAMAVTAYPCNVPINYLIYYHYKTTALTFDIDVAGRQAKQNNIDIDMYRNLTKSEFCDAFFKFENIQTDTHDYQNKFNGIARGMDKYLIPFMREKYDFHATTSKSQVLNYLLVLGWKLIDCNNDFIFYFVQRRCFNMITKKNVIRTAALQFATDSGKEALSQYVDYTSSVVEKIDKFSNVFTVPDGNDTDESSVFGLS